MHTTFLLETLTGWDHMEDADADGRRLLKCTLNK
jgi:hypothetical protein